ncbi:ultraviolet-B receptor UVR8 isoform X7 [Beta vulgaris subsp. vulgaris]|uniref:ultraviolet-B receptor UVR8 isoform X7 n=1 Tax=Beta vulgaris subsp. vulgaris TaxID=3555 RepID=UPI0020367C0F|nr:ultraviolet-B receptor UVR8 isoform X7 [Beta vulgaris subsp. vulgaris]
MWTRVYSQFSKSSILNAKLGLGFCSRWYSTAERGKRVAALWGNGDYGRLGLGSVDSQWKPAICSGFNGDNLRSIACGGAHTLFLTGAPKAVSRPRKVEFLNGIIIGMAALGSEHSIAVTDEGVTLSWGGGASGRLGHDRQSGLFNFLSSRSEYTPRLVKRLEEIKVQTVAAGLLHSACIDGNGNVFMFGDRNLNKLSFGNSDNATVPSMMSKLPISEEVACGGYHTCVLTIYHCYFGTERGELYTWGSNDNGCLGIGCTDVIHSPERVEGPFRRQSVSKVSCGWKHTAAISDGHVFTWGWGGSHGTFSVDGHSSGGQLGHGTDVDYIEPTVIDLGSNLKAVEVSCGFNHTGAIYEYC